MKKQIDKELIRPLSIFNYGSFATLIVALFIATFYLSSTFLEKEKNRAGIVANQISQSINTEYRYIVEEYFTSRYESIFIRVQKQLLSLGSERFELFLTNTKDECVFSKNQKGNNIDCNKEYIKLFQNTHDTDFISRKHKLIYHSTLLLGAVEIGHIYLEFDDQYKFFTGSPIHFIKENFLPLFAIVSLIWLFWLLFSQKKILAPYFKKLIAIEKKKTSSDTLSLVVHDTKNELESLAIISDELSNSKEELSRLKAAELLILIESIQEAYNNISDTDGELETSETITSHSVFKLLEMTKKRISTRYKNQPRIALDFKYSNDLNELSINIQRNIFFRVISNLVVNAVESVKDKNIITVTISSMIENEEVVFSVEDNGKGVDKNIKSGIFDKGISTKTISSGKGLYFVKRSIQQWNGKIDFHANVYGGTTFKINLPFNKRKYIVLDDDEKKLVRYERLLTQNSKKSIIYNDPFKLLAEKSLFNDCDIAILDYDLGKSINGADVAKELSKIGLKRIFIRTGNIALKKEDYPYVIAILPRESFSNSLDIIESYL